MKNTLFLLLAFLTSLNSLFADQVKWSYEASKKNILEKFFKKLLKESSTGYTLLGEKPFTICEMAQSSSYQVGSRSDELKKNYLNGLAQLEKMPQNKDNNIVLVIPEDKKYAFFLINRKALKEVFNKNISPNCARGYPLL